MAESTDQADDELYSYFPEVDEILIEAESCLQKIKGWSKFRDDWSGYLSGYIADNKIKYSLEAILVTWFDHELKDETDLFNDELPEEPEEPDSDSVETSGIDDFKKDFNLYISVLKEWIPKLIEVAPLALEKMELGNDSNTSIQIDACSDDNPLKMQSKLEPGKDGLFLKKSDWDALIEHAMTPYLPFEGGVGGNQNLTYSSSKGREVFWYVAKYEPTCQVELSQKRISTAEELKDFQIPIRGSYESSRIEEIDKKIAEGSRIYIIRQRMMNEKAVGQGKAIKQWSSKGFELYGSRGKQELSHWDGTNIIKVAKDQEYTDWESLEIVEDIGVQSFFKTGLTSRSAKIRGEGLYTEVLCEKLIAEPNSKWAKRDSCRSATIESLINLKLLCKYWKDICWFYDPKRINCRHNLYEHAHVTSISSGLTESWLWSQHEEKASLAIETFDFLNALNMEDLGVCRDEADALFAAWSWACRIKRSAFIDVGMWRLQIAPPWISQSRVFSEFMMSLTPLHPRPEVIDFMDSFGFCKKWMPERVSGLDFLWEMTADDFLLEGVSHWSD